MNACMHNPVLLKQNQNTQRRRDWEEEIAKKRIGRKVSGRRDLKDETWTKRLGRREQEEEQLEKPFKQINTT